MQSCAFDNSNHFEEWVIYGHERASTFLHSFICFIPRRIQQINKITSKKPFSIAIIYALGKRIRKSFSLWANPLTVIHSSLFSLFVINSTIFCDVTDVLKKTEIPVVLTGLLWHKFRFLRFFKSLKLGHLDSKTIIISPIWGNTFFSFLIWKQVLYILESRISSEH